VKFEAGAVFIIVCMIKIHIDFYANPFKM